MATINRRHPAPPLRPTISAILPGDQVAGRNNVTVGQFIVEQIQAGVDPSNAAGVCGVTPAEFLAWMRDGALAFARLSAGADWRKDFTPAQQDAAVFADQAIRARSAHIGRLSVQAEQLARGGLTKTRTVTKTDQNGTLAERTVQVETVLPDADMIRWKLERLEPGVYGTKGNLNITVTDMTDTDAVGDRVAKRMMEIAAALTPPPDDPLDGVTRAIEATGSD